MKLDERQLGAYFNDFTVALPNTEGKDRNRTIEVRRSYSSEAGRIIDLLRSLYVSISAVGIQSLGGRPPSESLREDIEIALSEGLDAMNGGAGDTPRKSDIFNLMTMGRIARLGPCYGQAYFWNFPERKGMDEDAWREELDRWQHNGPVPFVWLDLPPETTFPASWGTLEDEVVSFTEMSWWELMEIFSLAEIGKYLPPEEERYSKVTLCIYSNRQWLAYCIINDRPGKKLVGVSIGGSQEQFVARFVNHGLGRSAIRLLGGPTTGRREPGRYWISALHHVLPLIEEADRLLSVATMAMGARLFPPLLRTRFLPQDGKLDRPANERYEYGEIMNAWVDQDTGRTEDIRSIFEPQTSNDPLQLWQATLERSMRISGAVEVLEAALGTSDETAWARRAKLDTATHRMRPYTDAVVAADLDAADMMLRSIAEGKEPVVFFHKGEKTIELTPQDCKGVAPSLTSEYRLSLPQSKIADMQMSIQLVQAATEANYPLDPFWVMENFAGIEQPAEMYKRWVERRAWLHPQTLDMLLEVELKRIGADLAGERGMSLEEMMAIPDDQLPPEAKLALAQAAGINVGGLGGQPQGAGMAPPGLANGAMPPMGTAPMSMGAANGAAAAQAPYTRLPPEQPGGQPIV